MGIKTYCSDIYDLNDTNTQLCAEHQKWYDNNRAASIGDLIDRQQDMLDSYRKAVDNSTMEIADLKAELLVTLARLESKSVAPLVTDEDYT